MNEEYVKISLARYDGFRRLEKELDDLRKTIIDNNAIHTEVLFDILKFLAFVLSTPSLLENFAVGLGQAIDKYNQWPSGKYRLNVQAGSNKFQVLKKGEKE